MKNIKRFCFILEYSVSLYDQFFPQKKGAMLYTSKFFLWKGQGLCIFNDFNLPGWPTF